MLKLTSFEDIGWENEKCVCRVSRMSVKESERWSLLGQTCLTLVFLVHTAWECVCECKSVSSGIFPLVDVAKVSVHLFPKMKGQKMTLGEFLPKNANLTKLGTCKKLFHFVPEIMILKKNGITTFVPLEILKLFIFYNFEVKNAIRLMLLHNRLKLLHNRLKLLPKSSNFNLLCCIIG